MSRGGLNFSGVRDGNYRRGAIMGLTMAEIFILISFALLLLFLFWRWEKEREDTPSVLEFKALPLAAQKTALQIVNSPERGADDDQSQHWRFISQTELQRLLDGAEKLPSDMRQQLAELVEAKNARKVLSELGALEEIVSAGQSLQGISGKIGRFQAREEALGAALQAEIGETVAAFKGEISETGVITFPESVVFSKNSAEVSPALKAFLKMACEPWLRVLKESSVPIEEVRIEGHASSEWGRGSSVDDAYLGNLGLSQQRSQSVLLNCLGHIRSEEIKTWARSHLVAVGHSSSRPILDPAGNEDPGKSRRVVFQATPDRKEVLDEIGSELQAAVSRMAYQREHFGSWTDSDGDCINQRHEILMQRSKKELQMSENGCIVVRGHWNDPYTGRILRLSRDVEVDHLVPLSWAWERGASQWHDGRRREFFTDPRNLVVTNTSTNRQKSNKGPEDWLPPKQDYRCSYLRGFMKIVNDYELSPSPEENGRLNDLMSQYCDG
jgi:outer membrane protein OmpA-like peptidoglycan-associated protein